jgi:predicted GIY-YIG superfamily endonuclease
MSRTVLYRYFDADNRLLYVGISDSWSRRAEQHKRQSHWFPQMVRLETEWHEDRAAACAAETKAIRTESPLHNGRRPPVSEEAPGGMMTTAIHIRRDHWELLRRAAFARATTAGGRASVSAVLTDLIERHRDEISQCAQQEA